MKKRAREHLGQLDVNEDVFIVGDRRRTGEKGDKNLEI